MSGLQLISVRLTLVYLKRQKTSCLYSQTSCHCSVRESDGSSKDSWYNASSSTIFTVFYCNIRLLNSVQKTCQTFCTIMPNIFLQIKSLCEISNGHWFLFVSTIIAFKPWKQMGGVYILLCLIKQDASI